MALITDKLSISYRFVAPHPFDEKLFLRSIENLFNKTDKVGVAIDDIGNPMSKASPLYISKDGNTELSFVPERGVVGIQGRKSDEVSAQFDELKSILESDMEIDFKKDVNYLEILAHGRYKGKYQPMVTLNKYQPPNPKIFNGFFDNEDVTTMELRVCNRDNVDARKNIRELHDWFDLKIAPFIINPNFYSWNLVYRKLNTSEVETFWSKLDNKLQTLFQKLEEEVK